jgi:RNA polymerase sigma-70 factor (TIGR02943 family)
MSILLKPENWVQNHGDYLYRYARARITKKEQALDLVQDTFYSAYKAKNNFKGECSERTWLTAILKRKIIDHYRSMSSKNHEISESYNEASQSYNKELFFDDAGHWKKERMPENWIVNAQTLETEEFKKIFEHCLSFLPPSQAACFTLKICEELSSEEICKELNISPSNLWTSMHRAKLQLRNCMEKNYLK